MKYKITKIEWVDFYLREIRMEFATYKRRIITGKFPEDQKILLKGIARNKIKLRQFGFSC